MLQVKIQIKTTGRYNIARILTSTHIIIILNIRSKDMQLKTKLLISSIFKKMRLNEKMMATMIPLKAYKI